MKEEVVADGEAQRSSVERQPPINWEDILLRIGTLATIYATPY